MPVLDLSAYKPVPATLGDANQIANGMQAIQNAVNGLDNNNFAAGKIFDPAKLMQNAATAGQALLWDNASSTWKPGSLSSGFLAAPQKYATLIDIVSSTTETDILQAAGYSIPGNTLGATGFARVTIGGDWLNSSGGTVGVTYRVYFGGTKIYEFGNVNYGNFASRMPWELQLRLGNRNATNSQWMSGFMLLDAQVGAPATGQGEIVSTAVTPIWGGPFSLATDPAKDTTAAQTLRVTVQLNVSNASASWRAYHSLIEFL